MKKDVNRKMTKYIGIDLGISKPSYISIWGSGDVFNGWRICNNLSELFENINMIEQGSFVCVEEPFLGKNVKFLQEFSFIIGQISQFCSQNGYKFYKVRPQTWQTQSLAIKPKMGSEVRKLASLRMAYYLTKLELLKKEPMKKRLKERIDFDSELFDLSDSIMIGYWAMRNLK